MLPFAAKISRSAVQYGRIQRAAAALPVSSLEVIVQRQQQSRSKHSERQVKRLFRNHPAKLRVEKRLGLNPPPMRSVQPVGPPQYAAILEPQFLPNGWSAPPPADVTLPDYPFAVTRTKNKPHDAIGFLPVYSEFRKDGARKTTRVKKVSGDVEAFIQELRCVLNLPQPKDPRADAIRTRMGGTIEIKGNRTREIKHWLAGLGF